MEPWGHPTSQGSLSPFLQSFCPIHIIGSNTVHVPARQVRNSLLLSRVRGHKGKKEVMFELVFEEESLDGRKELAEEPQLLVLTAAHVLVLALFLSGLIIMDSPLSLFSCLSSGDGCIYLPGLHG